MPFDKPTRNLLAKMVAQCRDRLAEDIADQLQSSYGLYPDGTALDVAKTEGDRRAAEDLLALWDHFEAAEASSAKARRAIAYQRLVREIGFTLLNRLAALRLCEERGLLVECVRRGMASDGFQLFDRIAGGALGNRYQTYRAFLESLFDELALDLGLLFDRSTPQSLVFPSEAALTDVLSWLNDPELAAHGVWQQDETIGWIYQYYNDPAERRAMRDASSAPRNSRELAVRNQFFTPRYVVEFLTDNTLGRIWYEMRQGDTRLAEQCRYLVRRPNEIFLRRGEDPPQDQENPSGLSQKELLEQPVYIPYRPTKDPRDLKILDPACGSGHFLLYAFDLLTTIYEEAWDAPMMPPFREAGTRLADDYPDLGVLRCAIPGLILRHNLHGIDIDPRAVQIAALALWLRAQRAYQDLGLAPAERPRITKTNLVTAEPMPGDRELLDEFTRDLRPKVLGDLVRVVFEKMKLAGEAGSLLKIEEELADAIAEAHRQWLREPKAEQLALFPEDQRPKPEQLLLFDVSGITDKAFWETAEARVMQALHDYAARVENGKGTRRRLFTEDASQGFAFVDSCRKQYDVVIMNPPFGQPSVNLLNYVRDQFSIASDNVLIAFIFRWHSLLVNTGKLGAITDRSFVNKRFYEEFRADFIIKSRTLELLADLGWNVLDDANVEVAAHVHSSGNAASIFTNVSQSERRDVELAQRLGSNVGLFNHDIFYFASFPGFAFAYDLAEPLVRTFAKGDVIGEALFKSYGGLKAGKAEHLFRLVWEVPITEIDPQGDWTLLQNGSPFAPYYFGCIFVVKSDLANWTTVLSYDSSRITNSDRYFEPGISYGKRTDWMYGYKMRAGQVPSMEGHVVFPVQDRFWYALLIVNSSPYQEIVNHLCGQHKYAGYVNPARLEIDKFHDLSEQVRTITRDLELLDTGNETSLVFSAPACTTTAFRTNNLRDSVKNVIEWREEVSGKANRFRLDYNRIVEAELGWFPEKAVGPGYVDYVRILFEDSDSVKLGVSNLVSYCVGGALGRWDLRVALVGDNTELGEDDFAPLPVCSPGMLVSPDGLPATPGNTVSEAWLRARPDAITLPPEGSFEGPATISDEEYPVYIAWDGILVDDPGLDGNTPHPSDIVQRVREVLAVLWPENHAAIEAETCEILGVRELRDYLRQPSGFFQDHLTRYSKSRRKAPIYWPLSTPSGSYTLWLYYHRLDDQILYTAVNHYVTPKIEQVEGYVARLETDLAQATGRAASDLRDQLDQVHGFLDELREFREELLRIASLPFKPNLNDGVIINAAPLHRLFGLREWAKNTEEVWRKLEKGEYDWAHMAYTLWPDRVQEVCKRDQSIAIAHGLEELCEVPEKGAKRRGKRRKKKPLKDKVKPTD